MRTQCTAERAHAALDGFLCERVTNGVLHIPWRAATISRRRERTMCLRSDVIRCTAVAPDAAAAAASSRATNWKVIVRGLKDTADRRL